jgi:hypothetical protein
MSNEYLWLVLLSLGRAEWRGNNSVKFPTDDPGICPPLTIGTDNYIEKGKAQARVVNPARGVAAVAFDLRAGG